MPLSQVSDALAQFWCGPCGHDPEPGAPFYVGSLAPDRSLNLGTANPIVTWTCRTCGFVGGDYTCSICGFIGDTTTHTLQGAEPPQVCQAELCIQCETEFQATPVGGWSII